MSFSHNMAYFQIRIKPVVVASGAVAFSLTRVEPKFRLSLVHARPVLCVMTDDERNDLLELKVLVTNYLRITERQILDYDPRAGDDEFNFLILKARRYQQTLAEIDTQLLNDD